jgi:hypothetical protein
MKKSLTTFQDFLDANLQLSFSWPYLPLLHFRSVSIELFFQFISF